MARFKDIELKKDGVYKNEGSNCLKIANPMGIEKIIRNIDNEEISSNIWYDFNGRRAVKEIKRETYLNNTSLINCQKYGLDVLPETSRYLIRHFRNQEETAKKILVHSNLGFGKYEDKEIYKHFYSIPLNSKYCGEYSIKPMGNKEEWLKMFSNEVLGYAPLELICVIALSSVLVGYLGEELNLDTIIFHMLGNSTSGKSTATKLGISMFGYPDVKKKGLFSTYNATDNALIKKLTGIKGMPIALDELSMSNNKNHSSFIYKLANGTDKSRLNKDSTLKENETWLSTIISNGEKSLINSSNKNAGIQIRVIEARNINWTKSAENAEKINCTIIKNYGHIGVDFAKFVMDKDKEYLKSKYKNCVKKLLIVTKKKSIEDKFTQRRVNKYAIIYLTAKLFQEMLKLKLKIKDMIKLLLKVEQESMKLRNFDRSVIEYINQYIDINKNRFRIENKISNGEVWGKLTDKQDYLELEINPLKFEVMLKEGGYEDKDVVLKELKDKKILDCDKDRYTRKRLNDSKVKVAVIVIKLFKD